MDDPAATNGPVQYVIKEQNASVQNGRIFSDGVTQQILQGLQSFNKPLSTFSDSFLLSGWHTALGATARTCFLPTNNPRQPWTAIFATPHLSKCMVLRLPFKTIGWKRCYRRFPSANSEKSNNKVSWEFSIANMGLFRANSYLSADPRYSVRTADIGLQGVITI